MTNNFKFQFANINQTAFTQEVNKRGAYYANVVMWTTLLLLPLFILIDYLLGNSSWIDFILIRLIGWGVSYLIYTYSAKENWGYLKTIYWFVLVNIVIHSIICGIVPSSGSTLGYFLILSIAILIINTTIFWPPIYSIYACLVSYATIFFIYSLKSRPDKYSFMIEHGGGIYFLISTFSCFLAYTRYTILQRDAERTVVLEDAHSKLIERNELIKDQHFEIKETNRKLQAVSETSQENMTVLMDDYQNFSDTVKSSFDTLKSTGNNLTTSQLDILNSLTTQNDKLRYLAQKLTGSGNETSTNDAIQFNFELFDLNPEVEKAVLDIAESAMLKNMNLQLNISPATNNVYQDKLFTEQVINKLLNNIIRHSQQGSIITVRAEQSEGKAIVETISHGALIGIDKLNEMFNKLRKAAVNDQGDLSDLGLAATKKLVETMNGKLTYSSDEKTGNYFKIEFTSTQ